MKNVIIGQSGGPTSVINSSLAGAFCEASKYEDCGIFGMVNGIEGFLNGNTVNLREKLDTPKKISLLRQTPSSYLGSCRYKMPDFESVKDVYEKIFKKLEEMNITDFIYIGGNDSMDTIKKLSGYAEKIGSTIHFMGAPKTIDNDLAFTDHTPGYGSAAKFIAASVKEIIRDSSVYDLKSVTAVEIMGRNAGWLTAASVLSKGDDCCGPDLIYLPEVPFDFDEFTENVKKLFESKNSIVVAVSEGITLADGRNVCELSKTIDKLDSFGHKILTGAGSFIADELKNRLGCKTRAIELNTPQRAAAHIISKTDSDEAFMSGAKAVELAFCGETGKMVILVREEGKQYSCTAKCYDIGKIANEVKKVPCEWITKDGTYISENFVNYAKPLILGEIPLVYENGLPKHIIL